MVIDTSVLVAIALQESGWERFESVLQFEAQLRMSYASYVEMSIVMLRRFDERGLTIAERILNSAGVERVNVDAAQAMLAQQAFLRFGKGRHPAGLNFGDCFSYALAMRLGEPLLFKGNDFSQTDVLVASY